MRRLSIRFRNQLRRRLMHMRFEPGVLPHPVKVGMIGAGKAARYHMHALRSIQGVDVAFIANRSSRRAADLAQQYEITHVYNDLEEALERQEVDAVFVAVSVEATFSVAQRILERRIPCLIEKPLGLTYAEAQALAKLVDQQSFPSCVGFNRRMLSCIQKAQEVVGQLPELYAIHVEVPEAIDRFYQQGKHSVERLQNWLILNSIHYIDLLTLFGGLSETVKGMRAKVPSERSAREDYMCLIAFKNGMVGSYLGHWHSPGAMKLELFGRGYRITILPERNMIEASGRAHTLLQGFTPTLYDRLFKPGVYLQNFKFLEAVAGRRAVEAPLARLEHSLWSMKLAEAILHS